MNHLFLRVLRLGLGLRFISQSVRILRQWGSAAGDFTPAINERLPGCAPGESNTKLNAQHQGAMTITIVPNPKLGARGLVQSAVGVSVTHLARNSGFGEFLADIGDLVVVG